MVASDSSLITGGVRFACRHKNSVAHEHGVFSNDFLNSDFYYVALSSSPMGKACD